MNSQSDENEKNIMPAPKDIVASIVASILICVFNILAKYFTEFGSVLPDTLLLVSCGSAAIIVIFALNFILNKYGLEYALKLKYIVLIAIIGVAFVASINLFVILLKMCELNNVAKPETYDAIYNIITNSLKKESLLIITLCLLIIMYVWIHRRYVILDVANKKEILNQEIINKTTMMSSQIISSFDSFSETIGGLMKKLEFNTAMTSTIIPFFIDKKKGILQTYLITNTSYPEYTWMFPGGHIKFDESESPESIAKLRAKDEAGLDVALVDLYNSFDLLSEDETENRVSNMTVFNPPHYLYLFKLDKNAKCFEEKGHEYHIDAVYVGKVDKENSIKGANHRVYIPLPLELASSEEVSQACYRAIRSYYRKYRVKSVEQRNIPEYVEKMLYAAYKDFVAYAEKEL